LAVGIPARNSERSSGAVAMYRRVAGNWVQESVLYGGSWLYFGDAVAIQNNTLVVGAPDSREWQIGRNFVYQYDETHGDWNISDVIRPPSPGLAYDTIFGGFGQSVSIDGEIIAIGMNAAYWAHERGITDAKHFGPHFHRGLYGAAVYRPHTSGWLLADQLIADDPHLLSSFGSSVDVSDEAYDDECVAVGASRRDGATGENEGGSYIFCDMAELPTGVATVALNVLCCERPFETHGPYHYSLELIASKSVESHSAHVQVSLESPDGKLTKVKDSKFQLGLDGKPLKVNGKVKLGKNAAPGTYKLSVMMTKSSGSAIARHAYFDVK